MYFSKSDILTLPKIKRLNLINSITGIKPANLIGTKDASGQENLAIFSSVVHLGSNPALLGCIVRPTKEVRRHSHENILSTKMYTINHVPTNMIQNAHYTSAKFEQEESEFVACGFTPEYIDDFYAPFVKESHIKIGLRFAEEIEIKRNGTIMIVGEIEHIVVGDDVLSEEGYIDLEKSNTAGISGLNSYYSLQKMNSFPYARVEEIPTELGV